MIKKGIDLPIISPSLFFKERLSIERLTNENFSVCSVCKSKSLFLCHLICKYRHATYEEFEKSMKGGVSDA